MAGWSAYVGKVVAMVLLLLAADAVVWAWDPMEVVLDPMIIGNLRDSLVSEGLAVADSSATTVVVITPMRTEVEEVWGFFGFLAKYVYFESLGLVIVNKAWGVEVASVLVVILGFLRLSTEAGSILIKGVSVLMPLDDVAESILTSEVGIPIIPDGEEIEAEIELVLLR